MNKRMLNILAIVPILQNISDNDYSTKISNYILTKYFVKRKRKTDHLQPNDLDR